MLVGVLVIGACRHSGDENRRTWSEGAGETEPDRKEEAVPVEVATLTRGEIEAVLRFTANLEAERQVQVFAEAPRQVKELLVEEGNAVTKGQLMVQLQDEEQRTAETKAEIELRQARREYSQQESLYHQSLISEQVFNDAAYEVERLELVLEDARRELSYTEVRAPITGVVTERLVNLGDYVTVNQPLFRIVDFDSIVARVYVPEKELRTLRRGQLARISADALGATEYTGSIDRISPVVDPSTGTVKVTVAIPRQQGLRPGMYVEVELVTAVHDNALLLPKRALVYDNDQIFVFRLEEKRRVKRVQVLPELENPDFLEPVDGVGEGDQIVIAGQSGLKDNALVRLPGDPEPDEEEEAETAEDNTATDEA